MDYRKEYAELTKTEDFENINDGLDEIFGERVATITYDKDKQVDIPYDKVIHIKGEVAQFCSKWNLKYPKNPNESFDRDKEANLKNTIL